MKVDNVDLIKVKRKNPKVKEMNPQKYFKVDVINPKLRN